MKRLVRALAVAGVVAASSYYGSAADANHSIAFTPCPTNPSPAPTAPNSSPVPTAIPTTPTPKPTPTPVPEGCTPAKGERIAGVRDVHFTVGPGNLTYVELSILADNDKAVKDANGGNPVLADEDPDSPADEYDYAWDSVKTTPLNGKYKLKVLAGASSFQGPDHEEVAEHENLRVDNPPVAVAAPEIVATTTSSNTIKWNKAIEADVQSYTVYRAQTSDAKTAPSADKLKPIAVVTATEYRDTKVGEGVFWYAIRVTRRSVVTPEEGISSPLSKISAGATVKAAPTSGPEATRRTIPYRQLSTVRGSGRPPPVPDAPYSAYLPYDDAPESGSTEVEEPGDDPRGPVLPVAVGAFLVSSALALGRMPY